MSRTIIAALLLATTLLGSPAAADDDADYLGSIELVGFRFCPHDMVPAWGQLMSKDRFQALFVLFGNRYGGDASQGTFALPNLRDAAPQGMMYCVAIAGPFPLKRY